MFVHLHTHSEFSFLDGASKAKELVAAAVAHGMEALALTEHDNVASAVRFQKLARDAGIRAIVGAEVTCTRRGNGGNGEMKEMGGAPTPGDASPFPSSASRVGRPARAKGPISSFPSERQHLILLARGARGYANLCRILTHAHLSQPRGNPAVDEETLARYAEGLICLSGCRRGLIPSLLRRRRYDEAREAARRYREIFGPEGFYLELQNHLLPGDRRLCHLLAQLGEHLKIPLVATNNVHYAAREGFRAQDLLTCMRHLIPLEEPHPERKLNAEYSLKSDEQMRALFRKYPEALANTERIAAECEPPLNFSVNHFPGFPVPEGETAYAFLRQLVYEGAKRRYGRVTDPLERRLEHELGIIHQLGYDDYFLAVWDVVCFARRERIRCAGRGSAADSAVAYCLGITSVDSFRRNLMFERFMNLERANMPDIDVDFDARRRDDVTKYVYQRYGEEHVAAVCTLNRYRARLAIREVGKAMGFPEQELDRLAKLMPHISADDIRVALERYPELRDSSIPAEKLEQLFDFCERIADHPKFLGTHLGGLVIAREPILDLSPLQLAAKGINIVQFDKDDVEELGLIKLDLLCLRTLGAVDDAVRVIQAAKEPIVRAGLPTVPARGGNGGNEEMEEMGGDPARSGRSPHVCSGRSPDRARPSEEIGTVEPARPSEAQDADRSGRSPDRARPSEEIEMNGSGRSPDRARSHEEIDVDCSGRSPDRARSREEIGTVEHARLGSDAGPTRTEEASSMEGRGERARSGDRPEQEPRDRPEQKPSEQRARSGDRPEQVGTPPISSISSISSVPSSEDEDDNLHPASCILHPAPDFLDSIPLDDPATYERLRAGETIGAFQLESPAQRALQARLGADNIEDVVASVALIRPGPIAGNMVEPYIARRKGLEPVTYLHPKLEKILGKTYGVVLFQEQVIEIAVEVAGFTPGEADKLRRLMTKNRSMKEMQALGEPFVEKCVARGIERPVAETVFSYIVGYAGYGFCEAHAAAFGDTAYKTMYLLTHHPAQFYAALLSNQPMGFYSPNTLALEARRRGIRILLPDVNQSEKHFTVEEGPAIRIGLMQIDGIAEMEIQALLEERGRGGPFDSFGEFCGRVPVRRNILERMILSGCFDTLELNRKALMWRIAEIGKLGNGGNGGGNGEMVSAAGVLPISSFPPGSISSVSSFPPFPPDYSDFEKFSHEARILGINVFCHVMAYYREELRAHRVLSTAEAREVATGAVINVAGLTIRPHRPPTRSGRIVVFLSLEDEHGTLDVTTFEDVYQRYGKVIYSEPALIVKGRVERRGNAVSLTAIKIRDLPRAYRHDAPGPDERITRQNASQRQSPGALLSSARLAQTLDARLAQLTTGF